MVTGEVHDTLVQGLPDYPDYDINVQGTTTAGDRTEPLISLVLTGTHLILGVG